MVACKLIPVLVVACAVGCGGSLYQLKRVASRAHDCPLDRIETLFCENDLAMLNVCGTYRRYNYQGLHAEGRLFPPHAWQEGGFGLNFFAFVKSPIKTLFDMWGASASDVWAVGTRGALFHFDGARWESLPCDGKPIDHFGVWGADAQAVWVVGSDGKVLRWNGRVWTRDQLPTSTTLIGVRGTSRTDVWIVGRKGLIVHWDGADYKKVASGVEQDLYRVWAIRPDLAWAVGQRGTLLRWDGSRWATDSLGTLSPLMTVWARSAAEVWVGALSGQVYRWDGRRWTPVRVHSIDDLKHSAPCVDKILGFGRDDVWVMGCMIHHHDGQRWRRLDRDPVTRRKLAGSGPGSWGSSPTDVYGVTIWEDDRRHLYETWTEHEYAHWDGKRWSIRNWPVNRCK